MSNYRESDLEKLIDVLQEDWKSRIPWIQRKEISAWAGLIFYYAILWSLGKSIRAVKCANIDALWVILLLVLLSYAFARFVHAQYQSIYNKAAHTDVLQKLLLCLIEKKVQFLEDNEITGHKELLAYIDKQTREKKDATLKCNAIKHPFLILFHFWLFWIIVPIQKIFHIEHKSDNLDNSEREEAALYSLIAIGCVFFIYFYFGSFSSIARQCWKVFVMISSGS